LGEHKCEWKGVGTNSNEWGEFEHFKRRNGIANLTQDVELGPGWSQFEFVYCCRAAAARKKFHLIFSILSDSCA
jgi:hypothetical protein